MEENQNINKEETNKQMQNQGKKVKNSNILIKIIAIIIVISLVTGLVYWKRDKINLFTKKGIENIVVEETLLNEREIQEHVAATITETIVGTVSKIERNDEIELVKVAEKQNDFVLEKGDEVYDIYSMIIAKIKSQLEHDGFETDIGIATSIENDNIKTSGLYYYDKELKLFDNEYIKPVGFIEISSDESENSNLIDEKSLIVVKPLNDTNNDVNLVCSYSYNDILPSHFVYKGKYVTYYLKNAMNVVYSVLENQIENYDLSYGSLYDYDKNELIYDENILSQYQLHTGEKLFSEENYKELEIQLQQISKEQEKNGYKVEDFTIVYISLENIQAYLDGEIEDTFFGYSVEELTRTLGVGNILQYSESEGLQLANISNENEGEFNFKSFLTKVGVGGGIIIVGAALTPITGGASFTCALVTITKGTVTASLCAGLGSLAINTTKGMMEGKDFKQSIVGSKNKSLNAFANTFVVTSVMCSVGVVSGLIKPTACFVSGTKITTYDSRKDKLILKNIEDVVIGDYVLSYNFELNKYENKKVINIFNKNVDILQEVKTKNETILTTPEHFFYSEDDNIWKQSRELSLNENLKTYNSKDNVISNNAIQLEQKVKVYNLEVEDNHNYFVSNSQILVHNMCGKYKTVDSARQAGVDKAWAREKKLIQEGKESFYQWTDAQKKEILQTGRLKGYDGAHIYDVAKLKDTVNDHLISNPDNIALVTHEEHMYFHHYNTKEYQTDLNRVVEALPWMKERIKLLQSKIVVE